LGSEVEDNLSAKIVFVIYQERRKIMNTQEKYLQRQLEQVNEEMRVLYQKSKRIEYRYSQLQKEKAALQEDLKNQTSQTRKKEDLQITQIRKMNLESAK
jgi:uncharacterized protein (DUF3084 family)